MAEWSIALVLKTRVSQGTVSSNLTASAMKILGLDFGTKNIGVAVSDETATFAFPKAILPNDAKIIESLAQIIAENMITQIVIGDPGDNAVAADAKAFGAKLEAFNLPIAWEQEFMTSAHVSQAFGAKPIARQVKQERGEKRDDSAAALILQRYLDRK